MSLEVVAQKEVQSLPLTKWYEMGKTFYQKKQYDSAIFAFNKASYLAQNNTDTLRFINAISRIAHTYIALENYKASENHFRQSLKLELLYGDSLRIAKAYNNVGITKYYQSDLDSCLFFYRKALSIYRKVSQKNLPQFIKNIGQVYQKKGDLENAALNLFESARRFEEVDNLKETASIYNTLGNMYYEAGYDSLSLHYHSQAFRIRQSLNDELAMAQTQNNMGNLIRKMYSPDSAMLVYQQVLAITKRLGSKRLESAVLNNIGEIYLEWQEIRRSKSYFQQSLTLKKALNDSYGEAHTLLNLARISLEQQNIAEAEKIINDGILLAEEIKAPKLLLKYYGLYASLLSSSKRFKEATTYYEIYTGLKNSLLNELKLKTFSEVEVRYRTDRLEKEVAFLRPLEKEIEVLNLQAENHAATLRFQRVVSWGAGIVAFLLLCLALLAWRNGRQRKKINTLLEVKNQEISHRVKNNLGALTAIFSGQSRMTDNKELKALLKENENRIKTFAHLHNRLSKEPYNQLSSKVYFEGLIDDILFSFNYPKNDSHLSITEVQLDMDKMLHIALVLNELITNALKHGLKDMPAPWLEVSLKEETSVLVFFVKDNGLGLETGLTAKGKKSYGMTLVNKLVTRQLEGKLDYHYHQGAVFTVTLPR